jgi:O-antigen ligase
MFWKGSIDSSVINQVHFEGSAFDRITLSSLIVISFMIFYQRRERVLALLKKNLWLLGLLGYMLLSILWTEYPFIAFKRWTRTFGTIVMIFLLITEQNPLQAGVGVLKQACFFILPFSMILIFLFPNIGTALSPDDGITYWIGITPHKNILGQWAALGSLLFLWLLLEKNKRSWNQLIYLSMLAISWILLVGSRSITSLNLTLEGMILFILLSFARGIGKYGFITTSTIIISIGSFGALIEQLFLRKPLLNAILNLEKRDSTFTGRTFLWEHALSIGSQKMWFGHGYATFWISKWGDQARSVLGWDMYSAHNGFLDVYLQLGLVGILLTIVYIVFAARGVMSVYKYDFRYGVLWVTLLLVTLLSNLSESNFGIMADEFWFLSVLVSANIPNQFLAERRKYAVNKT